MSTFFDTNVLVYAFDARHPLKQARARELIDAHTRSGTLVLSTQVMQEFYAVTTRRALLAPDQALAMLDALTLETVIGSSAAFVRNAIVLAQRHTLSPWDALVVQAALDGGCAELLSEDLQSGRRFGDLSVVNPFTLSAHEPMATVPRRRRTRNPR